MISALFHSLIMFTGIPGELPGFSYTRALLLVTFGVLARAILVPSSPRRTLLLGLVAVGCPTVTSQIWYASQETTPIPASLHAAWTILWCLGGVVIATLASHVIFGLRQQVHEARQLGQYTLLERIGEGGMGSMSQHAGRVAHILRQMAASLSEAHGIGLVHRDIKPGNAILVPERGGEPDVIKVVDFGLVKELEQDSVLTRAGRIAGTPDYLSPEAISSPETVGVQSDIYALGCVGYYLVTGQRVFEGRTIIEVCRQHLESVPVLPSERLGHAVPPTLSAVLMACLQKEPARRPSARSVVEWLGAGQDIERWTTEMAHAWWTLRGAAILGRHRAERDRAGEPKLGGDAAPVTALSSAM